MKYEAISFDAAGTLIEVNWHPERIAVQAALQVGIPIPDPQVAAETYLRLLHSRWTHFQQLNLTRNPEITDAFWRELGADWLTRLALPHDRLDDLYQAADDIIFGPQSPVFTLYPDTLLALQSLAETKLPLIILSNWDVSLHRTCAMLNLSPFFTKIIASLEEGIEKPDPALFQIAQNHLQTNKVLHIGDDPLADIKGARDFGWHALLIDRHEEPAPRRINSLTEIINHL